MANFNVVKNYQTAEYGKFVELTDAKYPAVSVTRFSYPDTTSAFPNNSAAQPLSSVDIYPKYGILSYIANPEDISFSVYLSAENVSVELGQIEQDVHRVITLCDVLTAQNASVDIVSDGGLNAMRVLTQDLESSADDITIGDKFGNFATVHAATSALNVRIVNSNTIGVSGSLTVTNPVTSVNAVVTNTVGVSAINLPVTVTNTIETVTTTNPVQLDAFGRFRVSTPLTLFDSSHRYKDNNLWASLTAVSGTYAFNQNQGLMDLTVTAASGSSVIRETTKVFAYQPGKSLLVLNTFVFAPSATNLRQRVGYFGTDNGIYFQMDGGVISFVERSLVTGSPSETIVPLSGWNIDKLDGTGPSGFTLDVTKAQIFWMDIEWLGVGTVRCGFVIDGKFVHCHSFHHANIIASTYITTASLPVRYEITNKAATNGPRTMKQICSSVVSEGGYELNGLQQAVGTVITTPKTLTSAGTYYPVVSIRLKASRLDAIIILTALSMMPVTTSNYSWRVIASGTTGGGGAWQDAGVDSAVEYKLDGTSITGGRILAQGYLTANSTFGNSSITNILKESLFKFQLERNGLTNTPYEITLALAASTGGETTHASMDWEEISR